MNADMVELQKDVQDNQEMLDSLFQPFKGLFNQQSVVPQLNTVNYYESNPDLNGNTNNVTTLKDYFKRDYSFNAKVACLILLGLLSFVSLARSSYLDFLIVFFFFNLFYTSEVQHKKLTYVLYAFVFSFVVDFFWIITYTGVWWTASEKNTAVIGIQRTVIFFTFVVFFFKFFLVFLYLQFITIYKQKNHIEESA